VLARVSPLCYAHIIPNGTYNFEYGLLFPARVWAALYGALAVRFTASGESTKIRGARFLVRSCNARICIHHDAKCARADYCGKPSIDPRPFGSTIRDSGHLAVSSSGWVAGLIKPAQSPHAGRETRLGANQACKGRIRTSVFNLGELGKARGRKLFQTGPGKSGRPGL
jgi:hypothetical protein